MDKMKKLKLLLANIILAGVLAVSYTHLFNGLVNLAHLGLDDYSNEIFVDYSSTLYNFEQVRKEMDCIRQKTIRHGNLKIRHFLTSLAFRCQNAQ